VTPAPIPTREILTDGTWRVSCLTEAQQDTVININPCMVWPVPQVIDDCVMMRPATTSVNVYGDCAEIGFNNGYVVDASYWSGEIGWNLDYREFEANVCYVVIVGFRTNLRSITELDSYKLSQNYHVGVRLHTDDGQIHKLNEQTFGRYTVNGPGDYFWDLGQYFDLQRELLFPFWFASAQFTHTEPYFNSLAALAMDETYVAFQWMAILQMNEAGGTGHCSEIAGL
jgi:hypothetical protein